MMDKERIVSGDYRLVKLVRQTPTTIPPRAIITLTIDPNPYGDQGTLVFSNIPLPRRGDYDDLTQATVEEVQY